MALFFDTDWFDARLADRGLTRAVLAAVSGMNEAELGLVYKDQRELSVEEVAAFAELLGVTPADVAHRAGVSTPAASRNNEATTLYTIILEFGGGTYVDQVVAADSALALRLWCEAAPAKIGNWVPPGAFRDLLPELEGGDALTALEGLDGAWFFSIHWQETMGCGHVIRTQRA